jgi:hypothetical protein
MRHSVTLHVRCLFLLGVNGRLACLCVEGHDHGIILDNFSVFTGRPDENLVTYQPE